MDAAASMIEKAILANPTYAEAYNNLGICYDFSCIHVPSMISQICAPFSCILIYLLTDIINIIIVH